MSGDDDTKPVDKPVVKSWNDMKKEAKTKAREKQAEKILAREKKNESPTVQTNSKDDDKGEEKRTEEVVEKPIEKEEKPKIDVEAVARKAAKEAADDAAKRVGDETKAAFTSEINKILTRADDIQEKQHQADELVASWDKEGRLPKNYKELIDETMRIADAKVTHREQEAKRAAEEATPPAPQINPDQQRLESFQKQIVDDLQEIYDAKFLPKPASFDEINNPNTTDPNAKETQKVLEFGVKLNVERRAKGLEPITSLSKIYFMHYKPTVDKAAPKNDQPPGADAPVSPSRNQSVTQPTAPTAFYQKGEDGHYRAKSWAQIKYEALKSRINR